MYHTLRVFVNMCIIIIIYLDCKSCRCKCTICVSQFVITCMLQHMESEQEAQKAIRSLNGHILNGNRLNVEVTVTVLLLKHVKVWQHANDKLQTFLYICCLQISH